MHVSRLGDDAELVISGQLVLYSVFCTDIHIIPRRIARVYESRVVGGTLALGSTS